MSEQSILSSRCRNKVSDVTSIKCSSHWAAKELLDSECLGSPITVPKTLETHCTDTGISREPYLPTANSRPALHRCVPNPFSFTTHTSLNEVYNIGRPKSVANMSPYKLHKICLLLTYFPCYWELSVRNVKDVYSLKGVQLCTTPGPCNECYYRACSHLTSLCHCKELLESFGTLRSP